LGAGSTAEAVNGSNNFADALGAGSTAFGGGTSPTAPGSYTVASVVGTNSTRLRQRQPHGSGHRRPGSRLRQHTRRGRHRQRRDQHRDTPLQRQLWGACWLDSSD
jgi:hypothetical protein